MNNYTFIKGTSPLVATAIHEGHNTRIELLKLFNLEEEERRREEDPFTASWLLGFDNRIIVHHSRFEADVNRPREKAVYVKPEDAWGLQVWKEDPGQETIDRSLDVYDAFYAEAKDYFDSLFKLHEYLVVYDIHSYNHRRESPGVAADPGENPEINIGTKNMDDATWRPMINDLMENLRSFDYNGRSLDVRENVKFKGGYFGQWLFENYGAKICPISIEFKKFFMDEWTGLPFDLEIEKIRKMVNDSRDVVLNFLNTKNKEVVDA